MRRRARPAAAPSGAGRAAPAGAPRRCAARAPAGPPPVGRARPRRGPARRARRRDAGARLGRSPPCERRSGGARRPWSRARAGPVGAPAGVAPAVAAVRPCPSAAPAFVDAGAIRAAAEASGLRLPTACTPTSPRRSRPASTCCSPARPGPGKTTLAMAVARAAAQAGRAHGATVVTAAPAARPACVEAAGPRPLGDRRRARPRRPGRGARPALDASWPAFPIARRRRGGRRPPTAGGSSPPGAARPPRGCGAAAVRGRRGRQPARGRAARGAARRRRRRPERRPRGRAAAARSPRSRRSAPACFLDAARHAAARHAVAPTDDMTLAREAVRRLRRAAAGTWTGRPAQVANSSVDALMALARPRRGGRDRRARSRSARTPTRVVLLLDRGDGEATMIDAATHDTEVTEGDDDRRSSPPPPVGSRAPPRPLPEIRPAPATAITIDVEHRASWHAPLGTVEHLASSRRSRSARAFGGLHRRDGRVRDRTIPTCRSRSPRAKASTVVLGRRRRPVRAVISARRAPPTTPRSARSSTPRSRPSDVEAADRRRPARRPRPRARRCAWSRSRTTRSSAT